MMRRAMSANAQLGSGGYARRRLLHLLAALAVAAPVLLLGRLPWWLRAVPMVPGATLGLWLGARMWRRVRRNIDSRNLVILYFSDSAVYVLLIGLFLLAKAKLMAFRITWAAIEFPRVAEMLIAVAVGAWCGHGFVLYREVRRYEARHGLLWIKSFYSRSVTGPQGMLGLSGRVARRCAPDGKVELRGEFWDAVSIDGEPIEAERSVVVRDIDELVLVVEERPDEPD
jgi:membrane protein implicated in regulation of membrane protease activity